jgi:hypothetical protein
MSQNLESNWSKKMFKFDYNSSEYNSTPILEITESQITDGPSPRNYTISQPKHITLPQTSIHWRSESVSFRENNLQYHASTRLALETTARRNMRAKLMENEPEIFSCAI